MRKPGLFTAILGISSMCLFIQWARRPVIMHSTAAFLGLHINTKRVNVYQCACCIPWMVTSWMLWIFYWINCLNCDHHFRLDIVVHLHLVGFRKTWSTCIYIIHRTTTYNIYATTTGTPRWCIAVTSQCMLFAFHPSCVSPNFSVCTCCVHIDIHNSIPFFSKYKYKFKFDFWLVWSILAAYHS
jgi:hypothetical protein